MLLTSYRHLSSMHMDKLRDPDQHPKRMAIGIPTDKPENEAQKMDIYAEVDVPNNTGWLPFPVSEWTTGPNKPGNRIIE